jgi:beta-aspartyl-dipeptidase (metallo-type)
MCTSTSAALLAAGDLPAGLALARLLDDGADARAIGMSSDGQASLPHFDAQGRLLGSEVATVGSLLAAVRSAVQDHAVALPLALATVTANPARFWGLGRKGRVEVGADADLLLLHGDTLALATTVAGGRVHGGSSPG